MLTWKAGWRSSWKIPLLQLFFGQSLDWSTHIAWTTHIARVYAGCGETSKEVVLRNAPLEVAQFVTTLSWERQGLPSWATVIAFSWGYPGIISYVSIINNFLSNHLLAYRNNFASSSSKAELSLTSKLVTIKLGSHVLRFFTLICLSTDLLRCTTYILDLLRKCTIVSRISYWLETKLLSSGPRFSLETLQWAGTCSVLLTDHLVACPLHQCLRGFEFLSDARGIAKKRWLNNYLLCGWMLSANMWVWPQASIPTMVSLEGNIT